MVVAALSVAVFGCATPRRLANPAPVVSGDSLVSVARRTIGAITPRVEQPPAHLASDTAHHPDSAARPVPARDSTLVAVQPAAEWTDRGLMESPVASSAEAVPATAAAPVWDLEVEAHASRARVEYFVNAFSNRLHDAFERALSRETRYAALISDRLRAAGLPQDLTYLALVESCYDPHAYSRSAAVGMWQFMTRTARGVGLRVDWWVDERRDPVRATEGAVRLLSSLNDEFGSLFLAAAAYNGGSGRVSRGLTQFARWIEGAEGESKFFALSDTRYLRPETRDYVPKIIAAALVARQPDRYGMRIDTVAPFAYDSVLAPGGAPLAAVASAASIPVDSVRDLNPHLLRGMVPEGPAMWVRVPVGNADGFDSLYAAVDSAERVAVTRVVTKTGESMASIARKHRITTKQINWYNPQARRLKSGNLVAGQTILVPAKGVLLAARDVPNPAIEIYGRRRSVVPARPASKPAAKPAAKPAVGPSAKSAAKPAAKPPTKKP